MASSPGYPTEEYYRKFRSEVVPNFLYLTSRYEADEEAFLKQNKITHVLNVAQECEPAAETQKLCTVLHLPLRDSPFTDIRSNLGEACAFLNSAKKSRGRALVHCREGRNRSATFVLAYLMRSERLTLASAFLQVKAVRSLVDPNIGFRKQLRDEEYALLGNPAPSFPMTESECVCLLDLELVSPSDLGLYTDVPHVTYEGDRFSISPHESPPSSKLESPAPAPSAPAPKRAAGSSRSRASAKAGGRAGQQPCRSPARRLGSPGGSSSSSRPQQRVSSHTEVADTSSRILPPLPGPPPGGPLPEALKLLFSASDVKRCGVLLKEEAAAALQLVLEAAGPLDAAAPAELFSLGSDGDAIAELFRRFDSNGDGSISRSEFVAAFESIASEENLGISGSETVLCAANKDGDGRVQYDEFVTWLQDGSDWGSTFLRGCLGPNRFVRWGLSMLVAVGVESEDAALAEKVGTIAAQIQEAATLE